MQIPHSSSLSTSISDKEPRSSSSFFLYLSMHTAFCFLSSTSVIPLCSCSKEGNITAAHAKHITTLISNAAQKIAWLGKDVRTSHTLTIEFFDTGFPLMSRHRCRAIHINSGGHIDNVSTEPTNLQQSMPQTLYMRILSRPSAPARLQSVHCTRKRNI